MLHCLKSSNLPGGESCLMMLKTHMEGERKEPRDIAENQDDGSMGQTSWNTHYIIRFFRTIL